MSLAVYDKLLADIANRCSVTDSSVLRKSKELIALLGSKNQIICSESCKVAVCLELASNLSSSGCIKREEAIKYSGCKKSAYVNIYNNISKLLNLDKIYSIKEVCLLVSASELHNIASKLFQKYKNSRDDIEADHPMYVCGAVLSASRSNKIHINLAKLVEISRIKRSELEQLVTRFDKIADAVKEVKINKRANFLEVADMHKTETQEKPKREKEEDNKMTDEEYEEWKRRMLED